MWVMVFVAAGIVVIFRLEMKKIVYRNNVHYIMISAEIEVSLLGIFLLRYLIRIISYIPKILQN